MQVVERRGNEKKEKKKQDSDRESGREMVGRTRTRDEGWQSIDALPRIPSLNAPVGNFRPNTKEKRQNAHVYRQQMKNEYAGGRGGGV